MRGHRGLQVTGLALLALLIFGAASSSARTLYVGGTKRYSVALKTEAGTHYVIQAAGLTKCHFNEPYEALGRSSFSMFSAPTPMRESRGEWLAGSLEYDQYGGGAAAVRATFGANLATGTYAYEYSLESEHCSTGGRVPFTARRYVPAGTPEAGAPIPHLAKTYYGTRGPLEIYLAVRGDFVGGVRGDFSSDCLVGSRTDHEARSLFATPTAFKRHDNGRFNGHETASGRLDAGARFKEWFELSGRVGHDEIVGSYLRVRTVTKGKRRLEHCVTGPLPFHAARYVPAER